MPNCSGIAHLPIPGKERQVSISVNILPLGKKLFPGLAEYMRLRKQPVKIV